MSNAASVTLSMIAPGQTFTYSIFTQSGCSYTIKAVDQKGTELLNKTAGGVNWNCTAGAVATSSDATTWPVNLIITGSGGGTLSVLDDKLTLASYNANFISSYVVAIDDAGTGSDRDFQDLVVTINGYRSVG